MFLDNSQSNLEEEMSYEAKSSRNTKNNTVRVQWNLLKWNDLRIKTHLPWLQMLLHQGLSLHIREMLLSTSAQSKEQLSLGNKT